MREPVLDTDDMEEPVMPTGVLAAFLVLAGIAAAAPLAGIAVATATGTTLVGVLGLAIGVVAGFCSVALDRHVPGADR